jgi:hypothetical protein
LRLVADGPGAFRYRPRSARHGVHAFVIDGTLRSGGTTLKRRDSTGIWGTEEIDFETGRGDTDVLLVGTII